MEHNGIRLNLYYELNYGGRRHYKAAFEGVIVNLRKKI